MNDQEFIEYTLGKPWVDRATGPNSFDCWGIVTEYYRLVKDVDLPVVEGYADGSSSIVEGFFSQADSGLWNLEPGGVVFMAFKGGQPAHCGVVIGDKCLHAAGRDWGGQVCLHKVRVMKRFFDDIQFWEYIGP